MIKRISRREELRTILAEPLAIIFKHSTQCPVSARAHQEVETFADAEPSRTVYKIHVIEDRALSNELEEMTGVRHQSPQLILLKDGVVVWHDAHFALTVDTITSRVSKSAAEA